MNVKLITDSFGSTKVLLEDGSPVKGVYNVKYEHRVDEVPKAKLYLYPNAIESICEAEVVYDYSQLIQQLEHEYDARCYNAPDSKRPRNSGFFDAITFIRKLME